MALAGPELVAILQSQLFECWNYEHEPPCKVLTAFFFIIIIFNFVILCVCVAERVAMSVLPGRETGFREKTGVSSGDCWLWEVLTKAIWTEGHGAQERGLRWRRNPGGTWSMGEQHPDYRAYPSGQTERNRVCWEHATGKRNLGRTASQPACIQDRWFVPEGGHSHKSGTEGMWKQKGRKFHGIAPALPSSRL